MLPTLRACCPTAPLRIKPHPFLRHTLLRSYALIVRGLHIQCGILRKYNRPVLAHREIKCGAEGARCRVACPTVAAKPICPGMLRGRKGPEGISSENFQDVESRQMRNETASAKTCPLTPQPKVSPRLSIDRRPLRRIMLIQLRPSPICDSSSGNPAQPSRPRSS
jgi:hypothetical protein